MTVITTKPQKSNLLKLDVRAIRKMYQDGMNYREIARLFNKPPSTIYYYLKKQNTPMRKGKPFCLEKDKDKIIEEYKKGVSAAILCEKYHCYRTTVADLLKRNGITPNRNRTKRRILFAFTSEIKSLYDQGKLYKDIAQKYGVDLSTISRFVKARGWNRSQPNKVEPSKGVCNA